MEAIPAIAVTARSGADTGKWAVDTARMSAEEGRMRFPTNARRAAIAVAVLPAALALAAMLTGCPASSPVQATVPPLTSPEAEINGMMHCDYANGVLSNCALDAGATLDEFMNSLLQETTVTQ